MRTMTAGSTVAFSMMATPFQDDGTIDEPAFRSLLRRTVEAGNGVYLGSGGAGEGHALSLPELRRLYAIGVEECKGKTSVYANPPEARTAADTYEVAQAAAETGVDVVQIYQLDAGHGMRPTTLEQEAYYRDILGALDHPVALSVHVNSGYVAPVALIQALTRDYRHVIAVNVIGLPMTYFVELGDALGPRIALYSRLADALQAVALGAKGCLSAENNLVPRLCRSVLAHYEARDVERAGVALGNVLRLSRIVNRWAPSTARWIKMGLKILDLPGGNGVLRRPYVLPPQGELDQMAEAFDRLDVRRLEADSEI